MVERGISAVSLEEVGRVTSTSKSQMYHYFASKDDLVAAVVICVQDRILAFHGDLLVAVESLDGLRGWADSVVAFHRQAPRWTGCPLGTLSSELMSAPGTSRLEIQEAFESWLLLFTHTLVRLQDSGKLRADADPERLAAAMLASLEGGLLMSKALKDEAPLAIALDAALGHLETFASTHNSQLASRANVRKTPNVPKVCPRSCVSPNLEPYEMTSRLDFGWWASNAPTGGYLTRLSLEAAGRVTGLEAGTARSVDLHVD